MMVRYFLTPPEGSLVLVMLLVLFLPPLLIVIGMITQVKHKGQRTGAKLSLGFFLLLIPMIIYFVVFAPRHTHVALGTGKVRINPAPGDAFTVTQDQILAAYIADWREKPDLAPVSRKAGRTSGGYRTGHYRLQNGSPAVLIAVGTRVLVMELSDRYVLMAPDDFEPFVRDFDQLVAAVAPEPPTAIRPVSGKPVMPRMPLFFRLFMGLFGFAAFILGYLTRFNKKVFEALYPFDVKRLKDWEKNARFVGNFTMLTGALIIIMQFLPASYFPLILVVIIPATIYGLCKNIVFFPL